MRKLLIIISILCSLTTTAQWQLTGSKVRYVNGIGIPTKDTAAGVAADSSQILIRPADSSLYVKYKRTWMRVGGGGGSIAGGGTTNYIPKFTSSTAIGNSQIFDNGTNVGIGTASPWSSLSIPFNSALSFGSSIYPFSISRSIAGNLITTISDGYDNNLARIDFVMRNGSANQNTPLSIMGSGNVGIGTTSPAYKLVISNAGGNGFEIDPTSGAGGGVLLQSYNRSTASYISQSNYALSNTFFVGASNLRALDITSGGNVGIGTAIPSSRLDVSGTATATNLSVTTNATVGGTLNVTGNTTLGAVTTGAINASSIDAASGNGTFGNIYSNGLVQMLGVNVKYRNISATYTATTSDDYFINITSGTFTLNLPTAATPYGQVYVIKNSGTGTITVDPNGTQTIDGATTFTMNVQNGSITIIGDGSNWKIVSKYL